MRNVCIYSRNLLLKTCLGVGGAFFFPKSLVLLTFLVELGIATYDYCLVEFIERTDDAAPDKARDLLLEFSLSCSSTSYMKRLD